MNQLSVKYFTSDSEDDAQIVQLGGHSEGIGVSSGVGKKRKKRSSEESWSLVAATVTALELESHKALKNHVFKYTLKGIGKVLKCNVHKNCEHEVRIKRVDYREDGDAVYDLHERGEHDDSEGFTEKVSGIELTQGSIILL